MATVEPCTNSAQSRSSAVSGRSSCWAASRSTPRTPSLGSAGTDGALKMRTAPAGVAQHHVGEGAADIDADAPGSGREGRDEVIRQARA